MRQVGIKIGTDNDLKILKVKKKYEFFFCNFQFRLNFFHIIPILDIQIAGKIYFGAIFFARLGKTIAKKSARIPFDTDFPKNLPTFSVSSELIHFCSAVMAGKSNIIPTMGMYNEIEE